MAGALRKQKLWETGRSVDRFEAREWEYPTGMVWCPMKMSGMAIMKCARLQKELGCGTLGQFRIVTSTKPAAVPYFWPWLRRNGHCPDRASEHDVRELRLAVSPLRSVEKSRKNPRAHRCPRCGGQKVFGARQCRRCWRFSVSGNRQFAEKQLR